MSEDPQAVSITSNPLLSPDEIARKSFPVARKGVDGEAVRTFLTRVAVELRETLEREAVLRQRVIEAERRAEEPELDEATLTRAIGIETSKILWTAHDAAKNTVTKAEERAAELIGEAELILADQIAASDAEALEIRSAAEAGAAELTTRARAEADALLAAASAEAVRLAEDSRLEADAMTDGAHADAVELLDATKEECRRMVAEARELRNRTLADLAARRRTLHIQLEELRTGKDSLIRVVDVVAASVEELRERLASAEDDARVAAEDAGRRVAQEPSSGDLVELEAELAAAGGGVAVGGPGKDEVDSSGFATVLVGETNGSTGAISGEAGTVEAGPGEGDAEASTASRRSVDELFARIRASRAAEEAAATAAAATLAGTAPAPHATAQPTSAEDNSGTEGIYDIEAVKAAEADGATRAGGTTESDEAARQGAVEVDGKHEAELTEAELAEAERDAALAEAGLEALEAAELMVELSRDGGDDNGSAEAIKAESEEIAEIVDVTVAAELAAAAEAALQAEAIAEPDVEALARRDHLLGPVTARLGRALKRALQDDQNDLLNALRQASGKPVLDKLVPPDAQRERFVSAATEPLARSFEAGAAFLVTGDAVESPSVTAPIPTEMAAFEAGAAVAAELADDLSSRLRQRVEQALSELDGGLEGSADAAGAAYREWKGSRVEGLAGDFTTRAFAVGELAVMSSLGAGAEPPVRWVVEDDDAGGSCPDCDDNALAGPLAAGEEFPTGHVHPPVHPGCRCLLVPVRS